MQVPTAEVRTELSNVLSNHEFVRSRRSAQLLQYLVDKTLVLAITRKRRFLNIRRKELVGL